jgi:hypothetical protein
MIVPPSWPTVAGGVNFVSVTGRRGSFAEVNGMAFLTRISRLLPSMLSPTLYRLALNPGPDDVGGGRQREGVLVLKAVGIPATAAAAPA